MVAKIVGSFPPAGGFSEGGINTTADALPRSGVAVGGLYTVVDQTTLNWSIVAYYQAGATVVKGDTLAHDNSQYKTYRMITAAIATNALQIPRGFAAADVSNTGYYSFRYISGYCPTIKFLSNVASNQQCCVSGSIAGAMSAYPGNASLSSTTTTPLNCVYSLDVNAATAVNSGIIQTFML